MKKLILAVAVVVSNFVFTQNTMKLTYVENSSKLLGLLSTMSTDSNTRVEYIKVLPEIASLRVTEIKAGHCNIMDNNQKTFTQWIKTLPIIDTSLNHNITINYYVNTFNNTVDDVIHEILVVNNYNTRESRFIMFVYINNEFYSIVDQINSL